MKSKMEHEKILRSKIWGYSVPLHKYSTQESSFYEVFQIE